MIENITCISCPMGCYLTVEVEDGKVLSVTGNTCNLGKKYAEAECTCPVRVVTSTVRLVGGAVRVIPVKTSDPIPKHKVFDCIRAIRDVALRAPVRIGDVAVKDVCGTGSDVIVTKDMKKIC